MTLSSIFGGLGLTFNTLNQENPNLNPKPWSCRGNGPKEPQVEQRRQELLALLQKHNVTPLQGASTRVFQVCHVVLYFPSTLWVYGQIARDQAT